MMKTYTKRSEVVVVGGGISGLYAAWRLVESGRRDIVLLEASKWLGGRIHSVAVPGTKIVAELGAMRFLLDHNILWNLVKKIGLEKSVKEFDFPSTQGYFLRGRSFAARDFASRAPYVVKKPHGLASSIPKTPDRLVNFALAQTLSEIDLDNEVKEPQRSELKDLLRRQSSQIFKCLKSRGEFRPRWSMLNKQHWGVIKRHGLIGLHVGEAKSEIRLRETGFWNLLEYYLGGEGFQLIHDALGYESLVSNWNSAEAIPWFISDFVSASYLTIAGGMGTIVEKLAASLNGCIIKNAEATQVIKLDSEGSHWLVTYKNGDTIRSIHTESVLLAIPRRPLEEIKIIHNGNADARWSSIRKTHLPAVGRNTLFKVFLIFEDEWWSKLASPAVGKGAAEGARRITDLPIRQIYYYGKEWIERHGIDTEDVADITAERKWVMIMASYSDSHYVSFWRPFIRQRGVEHDGVLNLRPEDEGLRPRLEPLAAEFGVPPRMVEKIRRQLAEIHDVELSSIPEPVMGLYTNWGYEPQIRAGWHSWQVDVQAQEISNDLLQPLPGANLYICGEAYSGNQGWIEGALQSAERALERMGVAKLDGNSPDAAAF